MIYHLKTNTLNDMTNLRKIFYHNLDYQPPTLESLPLDTNLIGALQESEPDPPPPDLELLE
jgi:hypothetical protein